ncbi:hypothetical protein DL96DRAFT_1584316 [Flagelloscypha sp. PMI_526]|nr:hypothetical protein DL96DRAFT_1584316 [Flagelloscypha sp. PMI_526]
MNVNASQILLIIRCYQRESDAFKLLYAGQTLFIFDIILTFIDEVQTIWLRKSGSIGTALFFITRYAALANVAISLLPHAKAVGPSAAGTILRLVTIMTSECILIIRTWAIWERRRDIFFVLLFFAIGCVVPAIAIVAVDVATTKLGPPIAPYHEFEHCRTLVSKIKSYIVPYVMAIVFESVILVLSLVRMTRLRNGVPEALRIPFLDAMMKDGVLYYLAVFALSILNIVLVMVTGPQMRFASAQLQANFHSIISTRLLLHLTRLSSQSSLHGSSTQSRNDIWTTTGTDAVFTSHQVAALQSDEDQEESAWELANRQISLQPVDEPPEAGSSRQPETM